jgi:iron complex transport system substrate-binding protein
MPISTWRRTATGISALALSLGIGTGIAACGSTPVTGAVAHGIVVFDDLHQRVVLSHPVRRLVVLEPSNFEIVDALGLRRDIVGVDTSVPEYTPVPWRSAAQGLPSIGPSYPGVSVERIAAAKPQLVLATTGIAGLSGLKALHIPVLVLNPQSIAGVYHDIELVGRVTGRFAQARSLVRSMQTAVTRLHAVVARFTTHPRVFYDLGGLYTAGPHTFINSLIELAGGINIGATLSTRPWPEVSAEQVVKADPTIILVDPDATTPAKERLIPGFQQTIAGKTGKIEALPDSAYVNEPSMALVRGLRELIALIHPGALH